MPIYEYECKTCRKILEVLQRISDEPLTQCPHCHGSVVKLVSKSAFHLKGGGWYADGYSSTPEQGGKAVDTGNGSAAKTEIDKTGAQESKSEKKTESKTTESKTTEKKESSKSKKQTAAAT
jgi:putative FmdB family regulatory protein